MDLVQVLVAVVIGAGIFGLGLWGVRVLATPVAPGPDPADMVDVEAAYRCSICGLRLVVTHAVGHEIRAPRHCREEMEPLS